MNKRPKKVREIQFSGILKVTLYIFCDELFQAFEFSSQKRLKLLPWLLSLLDLSWIVKAIISSEALIELFKS